MPTVARRNPGELEFLQAVREVLVSIGPVLAKHPELAEHKTIERICEPERQIIFRVPWADDRGEIQINRGFRVEFNSALGPYKGGLRFHPSVNSGIVKFLGFEQTFKNALTGMPIGGGKGGADFDPKGRSDDEVMRFCQSFMTELYRHIGEYTDVPAGDIGVGTREIGYLFGQYKRITNRYESGVLTGKGTNWGGALVRTEATGYGVVLLRRAHARRPGREPRRQDVRRIRRRATSPSSRSRRSSSSVARVVACSDSSGYVVDPDGIDLDTAQGDQARATGLASASYAERAPRAALVADGSIWDVPCDLAFPCATQNELTGRDARTLVANGVTAVVEGANMPSTPDAIERLHRRRRRVRSRQGRQRRRRGDLGARDAAERQPRLLVLRPHRTRLAQDHGRRFTHTCRETADEYAAPGNYVVGANIAGFLRVSQAMVALGLI